VTRKLGTWPVICWPFIRQVVLLIGEVGMNICTRE